MKKTAFVLTGEGSRGAFQAHAMATLAKKNIIPDYITGISSGSMNAFGYSLLGPQELWNFWAGIKDFYDVFCLNPWFFRQNGLVHPTPLKDKMRKHFGRGLKIPISCPAVHADTGSLLRFEYKRGEVFDEKHLQSLMSCMTIPGFVTPQDDLLDGAAVEMAPLMPAIENGADIIYVILGRNPYQYPSFHKQKFMGFAAYGMRFLDLAMHTILVNDIKKALAYNESGKKRFVEIHYVYPEQPLGGALDFAKCNDFMKVNAVIV